MKVRPRSQSGFTLIELLVVIAIIAILAAILFPVFAKARESARTATCLNNLKQIGNGLMTYAQDYGDCLPDSRDKGVRNPNAHWYDCVAYRVDDARPTAVTPDGWGATLKDYNKSLSLYVCPSDTTPMPDRLYSGSYMLRHVLVNYMPAEIGTVRISMAKRPSRLVMVYEQNNWHRDNNYPFIGFPRDPTYGAQGKGADIGTQYCSALFMDGHVAIWPVPANSYTGAGYSGYDRMWFLGGVNKDKGLVTGNEDRWSLVDFTRSDTGQHARCDPYDVK